MRHLHDYRQGEYHLKDSDLELWNNETLITVNEDNRIFKYGLHQATATKARRKIRDMFLFSVVGRIEGKFPNYVIVTN